MLFYILIGFIIGLIYVEIMYRIIKRSTKALYLSTPLRVTLFGFTMAFLIHDIASFIWLIGGFLTGFVLNLFIRGWILNGLLRVSRTYI